MSANRNSWQPLPYDQWKDTSNTLHLFTQIVGKVRLALMPMKVEWAQVPLTINSRGLTSVSMPCPGGSFDISFDFIRDELIFNTSAGEIISFSLKDLSVASFYKKVTETLDRIGVKIKLNPKSVEMRIPVMMDKDEANKTYDGDLVRRWWNIMISIQNVFNKFKSRFSGKEFPVNFFWGSFDLSMTFFSGKFIDPQPGMDLIYRVAMDAEQTTIGFWSGNDDSPEAIFFAYTYPKPDDYENSKVLPPEAYWSDEKGEFILPYSAVANSNDPEKTLMDFCESTYESGIKLAGWDRKVLEHKPPIEKPKKKFHKYHE